ncbi:MAG TPA: hypothetical protein VK096_03595 [Actinomycetales bacterium]|nr:hypothetical protein [Actinomycetales bacterium]
MAGVREFQEATNESLQQAAARKGSGRKPSSSIPHHSMAITRSEAAQFEDLRVCDLAVGISKAQRLCAGK